MLWLISLLIITTRETIKDSTTSWYSRATKGAASPVMGHAGNDWAGGCVITIDNKLADLPIRKWRRATHRSMRRVQVTAPLFFTKAKMQALCLAAGKRSPTPSLSTDIAPLCQFQPSKRDAIAGRPSILTLRDPVCQSRSARPGHLCLWKGDRARTGEIPCNPPGRAEESAFGS
jgi:hypothetical protein